eukprot:TRINITY_DN6664_c0_g1_i1.p1 TRINITY_DN6664_c0_g1~~TRINITY_DN6664_c0_g1_i1.p1  ORF type:complete len:266 (-),score=13.43 TRINITY_DN6664_c0_g1_i1:41-838(-)
MDIEMQNVDEPKSTFEGYNINSGYPFSGPFYTPLKMMFWIPTIFISLLFLLVNSFFLLFYTIFHLLCCCITPVFGKGIFHHANMWSWHCSNILGCFCIGEICSPSGPRFWFDPKEHQYFGFPCSWPCHLCGFRNCCPKGNVNWPVMFGGKHKGDYEHWVSYDVDFTNNDTNLVRNNNPHFHSQGYYNHHCFCVDTGGCNCCDIDSCCVCMSVDCCSGGDICSVDCFGCECCECGAGGCDCDCAGCACDCSGCDCDCGGCDCDCNC